MMDPDTREWLAGRRPAPAPAKVPAGQEEAAMRAALQTLHDDLYHVLCLFWRGTHPGEPMREGRIREVDLYALHDRLSDIRRTLGLESR